MSPPQLNQTIRAFMYDLVENKNFNLFVAAAIIFSVVMLQVKPIRNIDDCILR